MLSFLSFACSDMSCGATRMCTIALQLPKGPKLQGTFPYPTPTWDVLYQLQPSLLTTYTSQNRTYVLNLDNVMDNDAVPPNATWVIPVLVAIRIRIDSLNGLTTTPVGKLGSRVLLHVSQVNTTLPFLPVLQVLQQSPLLTITALRRPTPLLVDSPLPTAPPSDALDLHLSTPSTSSSHTSARTHPGLSHITARVKLFSFALSSIPYWAVTRAEPLLAAQTLLSSLGKILKHAIDAVLAVKGQLPPLPSPTSSSSSSSPLTLASTSSGAVAATHTSEAIQLLSSFNSPSLRSLHLRVGMACPTRCGANPALHRTLGIWPGIDSVFSLMGFSWIPGEEHHECGLQEGISMDDDNRKNCHPVVTTMLHDTVAVDCIARDEGVWMQDLLSNPHVTQRLEAPELNSLSKAWSTLLSSSSSSSSSLNSPWASQYLFSSPHPSALAFSCAWAYLSPYTADVTLLRSGLVAVEEALETLGSAVEDAVYSMEETLSSAVAAVERDVSAGTNTSTGMGAAAGVDMGGGEAVETGSATTAALSSSASSSISASTPTSASSSFTHPIPDSTSTSTSTSISAALSLDISALKNALCALCVGHLDADPLRRPRLTQILTSLHQLARRYSQEKSLPMIDTGKPSFREKLAPGIDVLLALGLQYSDIPASPIIPESNDTIFGTSQIPEDWTDISFSRKHGLSQPLLPWKLMGHPLQPSDVERVSHAANVIERWLGEWQMNADEQECVREGVIDRATVLAKKFSTVYTAGMGSGTGMGMSPSPTEDDAMSDAAVVRSVLMAKQRKEAALVRGNRMISFAEHAAEEEKRAKRYSTSIIRAKISEVWAEGVFLSAESYKNVFTWVQSLLEPVVDDQGCAWYPIFDLLLPPSTAIAYTTCLSRRGDKSREETRGGRGASLARAAGAVSVGVDGNVGGGSVGGGVIRGGRGRGYVLGGGNDSGGSDGRGSGSSGAGTGADHEEQTEEVNTIGKTQFSGYTRLSDVDTASTTTIAPSSSTSTSISASASASATTSIPTPAYEPSFGWQCSGQWQATSGWSSRKDQVPTPRYVSLRGAKLQPRAAAVVRVRGGWVRAYHGTGTAVDNGVGAGNSLFTSSSSSSSSSTSDSASATTGKAPLLAQLDATQYRDAVQREILAFGGAMEALQGKYVSFITVRGQPMFAHEECLQLRADLKARVRVEAMARDPILASVRSQQMLGNISGIPQDSGSLDSQSGNSTEKRLKTGKSSLLQLARERQAAGNNSGSATNNTGMKKESAEKALLRKMGFE